MALLLNRSGAVVTGVDASDEMLKVARERAAAEDAPVRFLRGDAHALAFPSQSFDMVVSSRVLMHTPRWDVCVDELCRIARDRVVVDYPSAKFRDVHSWWRRTNHLFGGSTRQHTRVLRPTAGGV
jgi:ubiquinone/menaquinone biosynthesis C-methylase UbiE